MSASCEQQPHRLGQSDHCDLGRDEKTQHSQGILEMCAVRMACHIDFPSSQLLG